MESPVALCSYDPSDLRIKTPWRFACPRQTTQPLLEGGRDAQGTLTDLCIQQ